MFCRNGVCALALALSLVSSAISCTTKNTANTPPEAPSPVVRPDPPDVFHVGARRLPIPPIAQETPSWCWLASAEMIFRYYNVPQVNGISYQCGIMGALTGPNSVCFYNCTQCPFSSGGDSVSAQALAAYPYVLQNYFFQFFRVTQISAVLLDRRLKMSEIQASIDAGHPVEIGVTVGGAAFSGQAGHDVVLTGYSAASSQDFQIIINDPFPYDVVVGYGPSQNPYRQLSATVLQPGVYQLPYGTAANGLKWSASITVAPY